MQTSLKTAASMLQAACRVSIHILRTVTAISEQCLSSLVPFGWQMMLLLIVTPGCTSGDGCVCVVGDALRTDVHSAATF